MLLLRSFYLAQKHIADTRIQQAFAYLVANTPMTQEMADAEIAKRTITFSEGEGNAVVIMDEDLTDLTAINNVA